MEEEAEKADKDSASKSIEVMNKFLKGLGMPQECLDQFEIDHYTQIIEILKPQKKT